MGIRLDRRRVLCQYKGPFFQNCQIQSFQNVRYKYRFRVYQFRTLQQGWPCRYGIIVTFPSYFRVSQVYSRIAGISMQLSEIISSLSIKRQEKLPTHCGQSTAVIFSGWISTSSTVCGSRHMPDWSVSKRATVYGKTR